LESKWHPKWTPGERCGFGPVGSPPLSPRHFTTLISPGDLYAYENPTIGT
jgi:hypothetical protein